MPIFSMLFEKYSSSILGIRITVNHLWTIHCFLSNYHMVRISLFFWKQLLDLRPFPLMVLFLLQQGVACLNEP